jgi:hypothetical protein
MSLSIPYLSRCRVSYSVRNPDRARIDKSQRIADTIKIYTTLAFEQSTIFRTRVPRGSPDQAMFHGCRCSAPSSLTTPLMHRGISICFRYRNM